MLQLLLLPNVSLLGMDGEKTVSPLAALVDPAVDVNGMTIFSTLSAVAADDDLDRDRAVSSDCGQGGLLLE